jgi:hypothetical protein
MAKFVPYRITVKPDIGRPGRFRWRVFDEYSGPFRSSTNFATEREAIADAERFIDQRILKWQKAQ